MAKKKTNADFETDDETEEGISNQENGSAAGETAIGFDKEKLAEGLEKLSTTFSNLEKFGNETLQAYIESAVIANKAIESINRDMFAYFQKAVGDSIAATKAVMASKSLHEAFEHQADFAKDALEAHKEQTAKIRKGLTIAGKESLAPLADRAEALYDAMPKAHAA